MDFSDDGLISDAIMRDPFRNGIMGDEETATPNEPKTLSSEVTTQHFVQIAHPNPLVFRPARPKLAVQQPLVMEQPFTVHKLSNVTQPSHANASRLSIRRQRHDRKRMRKQASKLRLARAREEARARKRREESSATDRYCRLHRETDPIVIRTMIRELHADLWRACQAHEERNEMKPRDEAWSHIALDRRFSAKVAWGLALQRKKMEGMKVIKQFVGEEHTVEAWREWGKKIVEEMDEDRKEWEEDRSRGKYNERMKDGRERSVVYRTYPNSMSLCDEIDRAVEEAEKRVKERAEREAESAIAKERIETQQKLREMSSGNEA